MFLRERCTACRVHLNVEKETTISENNWSVLFARRSYYFRILAANENRVGRNRSFRRFWRNLRENRT